jgi:hypothetical protein
VDDPETFATALRGDDTRLRTSAGTGALVHIATGLSSVFVVRPGDDARQVGTVAIVGTDGIGNTISPVHLPPSFRVIAIGQDGDEFVLTAADGRTVHGTPDQFATRPFLPRPDDRQLERVFLETHLLPPRRFSSPAEPPHTDAALSEPDAVVAAGSAVVALAGGEEVWLDFESAGPGKVTELLPHTRALLADLTRVSHEGAEFLWSRIAGDGADRGEFFEVMTPTSLVVYVTGEFAVHYEGTSGTLCMEGYWLAVQFAADRTPLDHTVEA